MSLWTQERGSARSRRSLLVALCRRQAPTDLDSVLLEQIGNTAFRREFLDLARSHGVLGLTLTALPDDVGLGGQEVDDLLRSARRRAAFFELKRDHVVAALSSAGVRPVILKGAALVLTAYDQPCERDLLDLDILIPDDRLEQCLRTLRACGYAGPSSPEEFEGYRRFHFHIHLHHPDADVVEVHWALTRASSPFQLDASEVFSQSTRFERPGQIALYLPRPEHTLLHLVLQNLQEGFARLSRLVDIDRIVASTPGFDWNDLIATARKGNLGSATALSLQLAKSLLGAAVPGGVARELRPGSVASLHLSIMRPAQVLFARRSTRSYAATLLHELWLLSGLRNRLLHLGRELASDTTSVVPRKNRLGVLGGLLKLSKLIGLQFFIYGAALVSLTTPSGRARIRFWRGGAGESGR